MKYTFDTEYNKSSEKYMNVVCISIICENGKEWDFWTYNQNPEGIRDFKNQLKLIKEYDDNPIFVSYSVEAEARAFISLGVDPLEFTWIDLYLEYLMFKNHNDRLMYGEQLTKEGEVKKFRKYSDAKCPNGLPTFLYHFLRVKLDTDHKKKMRDLIISCPKEFSAEARKAIQDYCREDNKYLLPALDQVGKLANTMIPKQHRNTYKEEVYFRAKYSVYTAMMVTEGYPINMEWMRNLRDAVPCILFDICKDVNDQFPDSPPFKLINGKYGVNQKFLQEWILNCPHADDWEMTNTGRPSLALEAWTKFFDFRHDFPTGNLGAQMVRYYKTKQALNGLVDKAGNDKKTFWEYVGSDGRVRPFFGHYVAQSSRSQPSSTSYIMLKTAWQRSVIQPPKGRVIVGRDWASEEFLIAGIQAKDRQMIKAYESGDVYLYFGKQAGGIPKDGTKDRFKRERDLFKQTVLSMQYLQTAYGLAIKLTQNLGREVSEGEAQNFIDDFDNTFDDFCEYRKEVQSEYLSEGYARLPDGFYLWGDNDNFRSYTNFGTQGMGATIMRKAVDLCFQRGLTVILTLHDALYIECDLDKFEESVVLLGECMYEAFIFYFKGQQKEWAKCIRSEAEAWGPDLVNEVRIINGEKVKCETIHVDERAVTEYNKFKHYFTTDFGSSLL